MPMTRVNVLCLMTLALLTAGFQAPTPVDPALEAVDPEMVVQDDISGRVNLGTNGAYLRLNHVIGDGVGWQDGGFTTLGGWVPFSEYGADTLWYTDLRVFVTNDGDVGQNASLGVRHYNDRLDRFFGGAIFFDHDHGASNKSFRQFGFSLETMGNIFDLRGNGYFPIGSNINELGNARIDANPFFEADRIYFPGVAAFQQALTGGDAEIGMPILPNEQWLRGYVGGYAYSTSETKDPAGFRGRLEAQLSDDLSFQAVLTNDRTFGTLVNGIVDIRLGGGRPNRTFPSLSTRERMYLPTNRNQRIATQVYNKDIKVLARNPATNDPYTVAWVDNSNAGGGAGTYEDPFEVLSDAESVAAADLILVRQGTGAAYDGGIVLKDNQRLLGEGHEHFFDAYANYKGTSISGTYSMADMDAGFMETGLYPTITNTTGDGVILADNNEVSAFFIDSTFGNAITGANIENFNLNYLDIDESGLGGIILTNASGTGLIDTVSIDRTMPGAAEALLVSNTNTNPLDLTVTNVSSVTNHTLGLGLLANNSSITAAIDGYLADSNAAGLSFSSSAGGEILANVTNSTFTNSTSGDGVSLTSTGAGSTIDMEMSDTVADGSFGHGLVVDSSDGAAIAANITNGNFDNSGLDGYRILADNSIGNSLTTTDTTAFNAGVDGLHIELTNASEFTINVTNGDFSSAGDDAVDQLVDGGSTLNLMIDPTSGAFAVNNGVRFNVLNGSTSNTNLIDMDLSNAGANTVLGNLTNGSTMNLTLLRSPGGFAGQDGMNVTASGGSTLNANITDGDFSNNGGDGIDLLFSGNSVANLTLNNTDAANNALNGFRFELQSGADLNADLTNNDFSFNGSNAINAIVNGANTVANLDLTNVTGNNSGLDGILFRAENGGTFNAFGTDGSFSNSGNHGIRGIIQNSGSAVLNFDGMVATNSAANGLYITGQNLSSFDGTFTNGSFANSGQNIFSPNRNAVELAMDNSSAFLLLDNTAGNNNGQNGLFMNAQNAATITTIVNDGNFNDSPINAIQANVTGATSLISLNMTNTTGNDAGQDAINFTATNGGEFLATANGGSFVRAGTNGIRGQLDNGGLAELNFTNIDVSNADEDGLLVNSTNLSEFTGTFTGGSFANAGQDAGALNRNAIHLDINNSINTLTMTNVAANNAGESGFLFAVQNAGVLTADIAGGSFANAGFNAVEGYTQGNGTIADVTLTGTAANNSGRSGVLLSAQSGSDNLFEFNNGSISNSTDHGVEVSATGLGTQASVTLNNATVNSNGIGNLMARNGVHTNVTTGADLNLNLSGSIINGNRNNGISLDVDGAGSQIDVVSTATQINNNQRGDGINFEVTTGATLNADFTGGTIASNGTILPGSGVDGTVNGIGSTGNISFTGTLVDNNSGDGFTLGVLNTGSLTLELNNGASASNNAGYGINMTVDGPNSSGVIAMTGNNNVNLNGLGGVRVNATNGAEIDTTFSGNFSQNGGAGVLINGSNSTINNLGFQGIYSDNDLQGIDINLDNSDVNALSIANSTILNNGAQGVRLQAINTSSISNGSVSGNTISNNTGDGLLFALNNSMANLFTIDGNLGISNNGGNGIFVSLTNSPTSDFAVTNNSRIGDNVGDGVLFELTNSDLIDSVVSGNLIDDNDRSGVQYTLVGNSNLSGSITNNTVTNNAVGGVNIDAAGGAVATLIDFFDTANNHFITGNTITNNGSGGIGGGLLVDVGENVTFGGHVTQNTISNNEGFGVGVTGTDAMILLTVGTATPADGNTLTGNIGAGIAVVLQDSTLGSVNIQNNTITGTTANNVTFPGDGINIQLTSTNVLNPSTAQLLNSEISNNIVGNPTNASLGNAGRGIRISADGNSLVDTLVLDGNTVANNTDDGFQFSKDANANMTNVELLNNVSSNNGGDGLEVAVANGNQIVTFDAHDNEFTSNAGRGIHLNVQADTRLDIDLQDNLIDNNGSHGIEVTQSFNDPTDNREVTGTWVQNTITNNAGNGIALNGAYGATTPLIIGQNGVDFQGDSLGNTITGNDGVGISSTAAGVAIISNNNISQNDLGGVDLQANGNISTVVTLDNNVIGSNGGDGLELQAGDTSFLSIVATRNSIVNNDGRGVDSLNQVNATTFLQFGDGTALGGNLIDNNNGEGFYVVNTASANQGQTGSASDALLADGDLFVAPDVVMDLQFNTITNNGSPGTFSSAGLVIRVGTSNSAGNDFNDNGTAGVGNAGLAGNGRVNARVVSNEFGGNFGTDVLLESFVSTVNPDTAVPTVGIWNDVTFQLDQFARDPLARLNMVFRDNVGESLDVTRGASDRNVGNTVAGAFYQSNDPIFKSRDLSHVGLDPDGPFTSGNRRRNAQRLASGLAPFNDPLVNNPGFAYEGVGASTFRIENDYETAGFGAGDTFLIDGGVVPPVANANGSPFNAALFGELPFGWDGSVAAGTFSFLIP